jgi:hypothetical protein
LTFVSNGSSHLNNFDIGLWEASNTWYIIETFTSRKSSCSLVCSDDQDAEYFGGILNFSLLNLLILLFRVYSFYSFLWPFSYADWWFNPSYRTIWTIENISILDLMDQHLFRTAETWSETFSIGNVYFVIFPYWTLVRLTILISLICITFFI